MKVATIALNTFREAVRNKVLYSVLVFAMLIVGISALFGAVTMGSQIKVIKDFGLFSLSFGGAIITIISGVSLLNKELKQKTIYNILSKPVERWKFVVGKYLGLSLTVCVLVSIMGLGLVGFTTMMEGQVDWLLFQGILFALFEVCIVAAVAIFFSTIVITTTLTGLFTLGTFLAGRSISYLTYFMEEDRESFSPALASIIGILDWVLPDLSLLNMNNDLVYGQAVDPSHAIVAFIYSACYSGVCLILASLIFQKRELL